MSLTKAYNIHKQFGAQFVKYAGYMLPISYSDTQLKPPHLIRNNKNSKSLKGGILNETINTRNKNRCSIFDVSHMGQYKIYGKQRQQFLDNLVASDVTTLSKNKSMLTVFTNKNGGIMDDVIVTNQDYHLNIVCNGSNKSKIKNHLEEHKTNDIEINYDIGNQLYAIQGPQSKYVLNKVLQQYHINDNIINNLNNTKFMSHIPIIIDNHNCDIYTQGYTGENGFEISIPNDIAEIFFNTIMNNDEAHVAGLGARDILRLEAGYCLYGQDIDETTNILEARMGWIFGKNKNDNGVLCKRQRRNFPGSHIILNEDGTIKHDNFNKIRTGFISNKKCITPKKNDIILSGFDFKDEPNKEIGYITSGCYSPHINKPIAMGYMDLTKTYSNLQKEENRYIRQKTPVIIKHKKKVNLYNVSGLPII